MNNCKYNMSKICDPKICSCDDDITDVSRYSHLKQAVINEITVPYEDNYEKYSNALRLREITPRGRVKGLRLSPSEVGDTIMLTVEFY